MIKQDGMTLETSKGTRWDDTCKSKDTPRWDATLATLKEQGGLTLAAA